MPDELTTETCFGYNRREWMALPIEERELIRKKASAASQAELQTELDASTEAYFATEEWDLDLDDPLADEVALSRDDWFQEVDGVPLSDLL